MHPFAIFTHKKPPLWLPKAEERFRYGVFINCLQIGICKRMGIL